MWYNFTMMDDNLKQTQGAQTVDYGSDEANAFVLNTIQTINDDLDRREQRTIVTNGVEYSKAYEYNQIKGVNYAPPRGKKDDRQVSMGLVHEKIVSFVSLFLKDVFKHNIKAYLKGELLQRMGEVYELGIDFSRKLEEFAKKIALIYWEVFTQGDCFVLEDWQVFNETKPQPMLNGDKLDPSEMDYTYEFLEGLTYKEGEKCQVRRATSVVLDGRQVILGDVTLDSGIQDQEHNTIEDRMSRGKAEKMFGSLNMWKYVPTDRETILKRFESQKKGIALFNDDRLEKADKEVLVHYWYDKENNRFNIFVNGVMMLPYETPFTLFYPRNNYPITQFCSERMTGSAYSRSVPAKTKFNADFADWMLKRMALKFEQAIEPALLSKGKRIIAREIFRAGNVTQNVSSDDYERADPENKGVTQSEFSFFSLMKEILESQTTNKTTTGEISKNTTAFEIAKTDEKQAEKMAMVLDSIVNGYMDLAMRRCETIESKYTRAQGETTVDGKKRRVYQDFSISVAGTQNIVSFDDALREQDFDVEEKQNELFKKSYKRKEENNPTEYYLVDPATIRSGELVLVIEIKPEKIKDSQLQLISLFDEFSQLFAILGRDDQGGRISVSEFIKEYLQTSGRSEDLFVDPELVQNPELAEALGGESNGYNKGNFGKPKVREAIKNEAVGVT